MDVSLSPPPDAPPAVVKHSTIYHESGDIVISALMLSSKEKQRVLFRVHKYMLSHNSLVFADMLALPNAQSATGENMYEGVDMVELPDDADALGRLLDYIYNPSNFPNTQHSPEFAVAMYDVMALAMKYDFSDLIKRIKSHIELDWPEGVIEYDTWVDQYEAELNEFNLLDYDASNAFKRPAAVNLFWPEPASAIRFARAFNIPSLLPAAFYRLSIMHPDNEWNKYIEDMHIYLNAEIPFEDDRIPAHWHMLSAEDLMLVLKLKHMWTILFRNMLPSFNQVQCLCNRRCSVESARKLWSTITLPEKDELPDPLGLFREQKLNTFRTKAELCDFAFIDLRVKLINSRYKIWKEIETLVLGKDILENEGEDN